MSVTMLIATASGDGYEEVEREGAKIRVMDEKRGEERG